MYQVEIEPNENIDRIYLQNNRNLQALPVGTMVCNIATCLVYTRYQVDRFIDTPSGCRITYSAD